MLLLDTNVICELIKAASDAAVLTWIDSVPPAECSIASITQAELLAGVAFLPPGRRRDNVALAIEAIFADLFRQRVLPFDSAAASAYAEIVATRGRAGRPISAFDAAIAAIARSRGARLATQNIGDFEGCGVDVVDPWTSRPDQPR